MLIASRIQGLRSLQMALGCLVAVVVYWLWLAAFVLIKRQWTIDWEHYALLSCVVIAAFAADFFKGSRWLAPPVEDPLRGWGASSLAAVQTFTVFAAIATVVVLLKNHTISRTFLAGFLPMLFVSLLVVHKVSPRWLASHLFRGRRRQKLIAIGNPRSVARLRSWIKEQESLGFMLLGIVSTEDRPENSFGDIPCLGGIEDLPTTLSLHRPAVLLHIGLPSDETPLGDLQKECDAHATRLVVAYDFAPEISHQAKFFSSGGVHLMGLRNEPLESPINRVMKRVFDVALSLFVVVFVLPFAAVLVWILQRSQAPGPLIYRQTRLGLYNQEFTIYKFRTMRVGEEAAGHSNQTTSTDQRVFPAARWLRKSSLDELPQFINVLLGEMSVVGPRPHIGIQNEMFCSHDPRYHVRHVVKPGITGLAQVRGFRGETRGSGAVVGRVSADLHYLENWSFGLDVQIVARTALQVLLFPKSAC